MSDPRKQTEVKRMGVPFALIVGSLFSLDLLASGESRISRFLVVAALSSLSGWLFGIAFWHLYGKKHQ